jgi:hypothetical protein
MIHVEPFPRILLAVCLSAFIVFPASGQSSVVDPDTPATDSTTADRATPDGAAAETTAEMGDPAKAAESRQPLPGGFGKLRFGMTMDEAKAALAMDRNFDFRGDPDVTLLNKPNEKAIDTRGIGFVERGFFRFHEGRLYLIHILLNTEEMDHFTMFNTLSEKYGEPEYLDPRLTFWEDTTVRLAIERPLGVKYIYKPVFEAIFEANSVEESIQAMYTESFLDQF